MNDPMERGAIGLLAEVTLASGHHRATLRSSPEGLRLDASGVRTLWRLWRTLARAPGRLRRLGAPVELAVRGRRVALLDARSGALRPLGSLKALFGSQATTRYRAKWTTVAYQHLSKEHFMSTASNDTRTWPELAIGLYEQLTGRGAEISYQFDDLEVSVPSRVGEGADFAKWRLNGALRIRTQEK